MANKRGDLWQNLKTKKQQCVLAFPHPQNPPEIRTSSRGGQQLTLCLCCDREALAPQIKYDNRRQCILKLNLEGLSCRAVLRSASALTGKPAAGGISSESLLIALWV